VRDHWNNEGSEAEYDFFFLHEKRTDKAGEDGDFDRKVDAIEQVDETIPALMEARPDVVFVTGDHSTPAAMQSHSWHPVPVLMHGGRCRSDGVETFGEAACRAGEFGTRLPARELMPLALANAGRLEKYGA
jgi:2,3-bisphosphoglycerate-independent phosphoglycerate mutase